MPLFGIFETPLLVGMVAAGAASVPVLIHLLNRRRFRIVPWAAMRFLLAAQKKNTKRMRLEQLLLLAVRTLLVLLLVLAMASVMPWSEKLWYSLFPESAVRAASGSRRTHKILVLDGSFSMATKTGEQTCFEKACAVANQILQESTLGDGFSVVLASSPARRIVPEPSDDARKVADEIDHLRLPHGNADMTGALTAIDEILRTSPAKYEDRVVYFLTDLQRSTWNGKQPGETGQVWQHIQERGRFVLVDVGREDVVNSAVTQVSIKVPFVLTGTATPIAATLQHYGPAPRTQVRVQLLVGKARETATDTPFGLRVIDERKVDLKPGQNQVSFSHKFMAPGDYAIQVRMDADAIEPDDSRTVIVTVKDNVQVMLVNGKPAPEMYDQATDYLQAALNPFPETLSPKNIPARPHMVTESKFADAALGDLSAYDCVFICDVARMGTGEVRRLEAHLERGGGVIFCMGPQVDIEAYNRIVYRNGEGILPARLLSMQAAPEKDIFRLFAEEKSFHVPPLEAFAADRDRNSLLSARFRQYMRVELPQRGQARKILSFMPEISPPSPSAVIDRIPKAAPLPVGDAALVEWPRRRGRVLLFTSTVNMDWTSWPASPSFPALIQELLPYAVAGRLHEQSSTVGDILEQFQPSGSAGLEMVMSGPEGHNESLRSENRDEFSVFRYTGTEQDGVYRAVIGLNPRDWLFAVNVPIATDSQQSSESDPARTNELELRTSYPGADLQVVTDFHKAIVASGPSSEAGTESTVSGMGKVIARWLMLFMLLLLAAEVIMAWRFGHYTAVVDGTKSPPAPGRLIPMVVAALAAVLFIGLFGVLAHAAWTGDLLGFLSDETRSGIEARLGIPPPAPGEGTHWRLEYTPYLVDGANDPWLAGGWALAMVVLVVMLYFREGRTASTSYKLLLAGLRLFFVFLMLIVLLPEVQLWFERQGWPDVVILLDDSGSMSTVDSFQDEHVREAAGRLAKKRGVTDLDRLQLAQTLLTQNDNAWLANLLGQRRVKVHIYHAASEAKRVADATEVRELEKAGVSINELKADGQSTKLGGAVRQILNDFRGSSLSAVICFTDGITTEGEDLLRSSRYAAQMGVPLFFVGLGDVHDVKDLKLHDLQVEDSVYVNDRLVFEARLTAQGYTQSKLITATLSEKDPKTGQLKELASERVTTDPSGKPVKFRITYQPTQPGEKTYVLSVPEQADEIKPADNNRLERKVFVRETKLIKVLYVEGYARYEYRFIKALLERESEKEKGNKTIDLKVLLVDANPEFASEDKSGIVDFPTREELNAYDVVIWGDVDPRDRRIGDRNLQNLANFVKERGGGFLMIAGPRYFSPYSYKDTPLRDILPIQIVSAPPEEPRANPASFRPELTPIGRFHPIFRFRPDEGENQAVWKGLAEIYWFATGYRPQPAAEVLMIHPDAPAMEPRRPGDPNRHPLLLQQFVGAGRSMFMGIDETWAWRFREDEAYFNQFWVQMVRHLARSRQGRTDLHLDRETPYRRGEPIRITVRFPDDSPAPSADARVEVIMTRTPPRTTKDGQPMETEKETLRLAKVEGSRAAYETMVTRTPEGDYRFWLSNPIVPDPKPRAETRVLPLPGEMEVLRMNQIDMERAAEETHGHFYTLADADHLLDDLPPGSRVAVKLQQQRPLLIWNHAALFALGLGLLSAEWLLRKRKHLL
ncbi:MAG TPA: VWA domain-containing protein [Gemmataceae bacterium]|jgi:hypothetical protein|nr:VWA domain-containing protein [Gemmataceae bacterium]